MSRLTKHDKRHRSGYQIPSDYSNYHENVFVKLGKLEDLEDELGCPLDVVFRALKEGIYIENIYGELINFKCRLVYKNEELGWYFNIINEGYVLLKDYKKTWWLKEDLSE